MFSKINGESVRTFLGVSLAVVTQYALVANKRSTTALCQSPNVKAQQQQRTTK